ncbi:AAA family ATPase [Sungkyunkwania multivorans]|uniref:AAA family ATPase n=1 Tax=Sungkyunkwania multivorans TaxID=1173618 RepID=A0ABW3D020_9FLAO
MTTKRIVITGGPGTGKTSIINELVKRGHRCLEEVSRQVTLEARENGVEQLFLTDPILFSKKLLDGRIAQFEEASSMDAAITFLDRGIPDVVAYMDFIGDPYPEEFTIACREHAYDMVFVLKPWEDIFVSDSERYENFEQAQAIHHHLVDTYSNYGYALVDVPFGTVEERTNFVVNVVNSL